MGIRIDHANGPMGTIRSTSTLKPLCPIRFVDVDEIQEIPPELISICLVGEKAYGLSSLPEPWTLPFVVVSDKLFASYKHSLPSSRPTLINKWSQMICAAAKLRGIDDAANIIIRSSSCSEGLEERGKFHSVPGRLSELSSFLTTCLEKLESDPQLKDHFIPLVVQKHVVPVSSKGHLSNERRCYEEKRDWLGQFETVKQENPYFIIALRGWRKKISIDNLVTLPLSCNLTARISEVLKIPATWGWKNGLRLHFEWVWDGKAIYLVQADEEKRQKGVDPTKLKPVKFDWVQFHPACLIEINQEHAKKYNKIRNVFTYMKLGLPRTKLYVLDKRNVIEELARGGNPENLVTDIEQLVKGSLVIRMDIATDDKDMRQLLPRTHEVRTLSEALEWLKQQSRDIKKNKLFQFDVVFIFHNFVPSISSAFAFAAPGERKVQIESLWGLPEGLYYNSHDKYIVDTQTSKITTINRDDFSRFSIHIKPYFKQFFVSPDEDGRWTTKVLKSPFDWKGSITNTDWAKEIAFESRRIADEEGKPLSIMWFVGVASHISSRPVLPWYHEPYDSKVNTRAKTSRTKTPFDKSLVIRTSNDVALLRQEVQKDGSNVRRVRIQPTEEALLRDKDTLRTIGELVRALDAVILLEGGVLSHAYYQLLQTGAVVEVLHPFEILDDRPQEFYKLVRDKIPGNIQAGGEVITKTTLSGEFLLRALKEKLVEESFEVLDATDQDSIVGELADVSEIIDEILVQLKVSREDLRYRQERKREKVGGFKDGVVLLETRNPLPTTKDSDISLFEEKQAVRDDIPLDAREVMERSKVIEAWTDRRQHKSVTEILLNLLVPVVRESWAEKSPEITMRSGADVSVQTKITGKRIGSKLQIELSIFSQEQEKLFK